MATRRASREGPGDPNRLAIEHLLRLLNKSGGQRITVKMLRADLASGAPTNADGTVNLVHYAAWLVHEMACGD